MTTPQPPRRRCPASRSLVAALVTITALPLRPTLACLLATSLFPAVAHAQVQTGTIEGRVAHAVTGASLENVRVTVKGTSQYVLTDVGGRFQLTNVPAGEVTLRFFYTGLDEVEKTLNVQAGQLTEADQTLTKAAVFGRSTSDTVELDAFEVKAEQETDASTIAVNEQRFARNIISVVSADEFGTVIDNNPGELLKNLPGMDVEYFGGTIVSVSVRGLGAANTEMNFDGMPSASANAENASRGFEVQHASAADIARVEVRRVPLPEDSSNSIGGSINMVRRSAFERTKREISYRAVMLSDGDRFTFDRMDGPKDRLLSRWRPNWNITWTEPITKDLGIVLTTGQTDMINNVRWSSPGWNIGSATTFAAAEAAIAAGQPVPTVPSLYNPALSNLGFSNAPYRRGSTYANFRVDWRPVRELTLNWAVNYNKNFKEEIEETRFRLNAAATGSGNSARYNDPTMTLGRVGGGAVRHENIKWRDHFSPAFNTLLAAQWKKNNLELNARASWAKSMHIYRDTDRGFFESASVSGSGVDGLVTAGQLGIGAGTANPIPLTIDFYDLGYYATAGRVEVRTTASGLPSTNIDDYTVPVDWQNPANWRIGAASSRPGEAKEIVTAGKLFGRYTLGNRDVTVRLQLGLDYVERFRSRDYIFRAWNYLGADGVANSADDSAAAITFLSAGPRADPDYGHPTPERVSMSRLYELYLANPSWFVYDEERSTNLSLRNNAAYRFNETTIAPYVQFEARLFRNRLQLTGGVRREEISLEGRGLLTDRSKAYMKYADGSIVRANDRSAANQVMVSNRGSSTNVNYQLNFDPSVIPSVRAGAPILSPEIQAAGNAMRAAGRTTDTNTNLGRSSLLYTNAVYTRLGAYGEGESKKNFPSLHANFNLTDNLVFQAAYALTMAKPDLEDAAIPNDDISDNPVTSGNGEGAVGRVTLTNPDLKPWEADVYNLRLAYYTNSGGTIALGVFRHNVSDFISQIDTEPLTPEALEEWRQLFPEKDLGDNLVGYTIRTQFNDGSSRLEGADIEGRQRLDAILPSWAKGFTLGGSLAYANRKGANTGSLGRNRTWRGTANLSYSSRRFTARVNYSMNGEMVENAELTNGSAPGVVGRQVLLQQNVIDVQATYRINRWAEVFVNAGNISNALRIREQQMPGRPELGSMTSSSTLGKSWAIGLQGKF